MNLKQINTMIVALMIIAGGLQAGVKEMVGQFPAPNAAAANKSLAALVATGKDGLKELTGMLIPPGTGDDTRVRYAVHGLSYYVARPGAEADRALYEGVLIDALAATDNREIKAFLIRQLELVGKDNAVSALAGYLAKPELTAAAARALQTIGSDAATSAIAAAVKDSKGRARQTLIMSLGDLGSDKAKDAYIEAAKSDDAVLRDIGLYAIANAGVTKGEALLVKASNAKSPLERSQGTALLIDYARKRAADGDKDTAARICRDLISSRTAKHERNVASAALTVLVDALGDDATDDVLKAMDSSNHHLRATVVRFAKIGKGKKVTDQWVKKLKAAEGYRRLTIQQFIVARGDQAALPALLDELKHADYDVRVSVIPGLAKLGGAKAVPALIGQLGDKELAGTLQDTLIRLPGDGVASAIAAALSDANEATIKTIPQVLTLRGASDHAATMLSLTTHKSTEVQVSALKSLATVASADLLPQLIKVYVGATNDDVAREAGRSVKFTAGRIADRAGRADAVLAAIKSSPSNRAKLLDLLPDIGGANGLAAVVADTKSKDAAVRSEAVELLSEWSDVEAVDALQAVIASTKSAEDRSTALAGLSRLVKTSDLPNDRRLSIYVGVLKSTQAPADVKRVMSGLSTVQNFDALKVVGEYIDNKDVQAEAVIAAMKIGLPGRDYKGLRDKRAKPILEKAMNAASNDAIKANFRKFLQGL